MKEPFDRTMFLHLFGSVDLSVDFAYFERSANRSFAGFSI
ncbi:hypothetical protein RV08_GL002199 [Enterococcus mundtii]|nr:hypothetical protein RV08_GL002199 [Enterococcus mundtii]